VALVFAGSSGLFLMWDLVVRPRRQIEELLKEKEQRIAGLVQEKARLETYLRLLKHSERRAQVEVLQQEKDAAGRTVNTLRFRELDPDGTPVGPARDFQLVGDEVYIDTLVIKFEDHFIEQGDPLKGKALLLLRRVFSNQVAPDQGYRLDKEYEAPEVFASRKAPTEFERDLWKRFWEVANSAELQKKMGVEAAHGQAVYGRLQPNKVYLLIMRSTGETSFPPPTELEKAAK
jgi:hypothetical protein